MARLAAFLRPWLLLVLAGGVLAGCASATRDPLSQPVPTGQGLLAGVPGRDAGVRVFKGIPYAAPPTGALRWRPPQPPAAWDGVRTAAAFSPVCPQHAPAAGSFYQREFVPRPHPQSEDCLYLNVWTAAPSSQARRPVMVWLHAGGFVWGSGADPAVDGEALARQGVVLVTVNYRVGALGFLAHPALSAESGRGASGNYGLHDQIAALRWVRQHIAAFGGDPDRVTVFGLSAGAISAQVLTASPLAKGLFHRAIAQSGSALAMRSQMPLAEAERMGVAYAQAVGAQDLQALRALPVAQLLQQPLRVAPVVDGWLLPQEVDAVFGAGRQNDVPLLLGGTAQEGSAMPATVTVDSWRQSAQRQYGARSAEFLDLAPHATDAQAWNAMVDSLSDRVEWGARTWARAQARTGTRPVYLYAFERAPPGRDSDFYGAFHMADIVYVFDNLWATDRPWTASDRRLARSMSAAWVRFARDGDPNGADLPDWPRFDAQNDRVMVFGEQIGTRAGARRPEAMRFLDSVREEGGAPR